MAWIESHQELGRHPKTRKAARLLDCSVPQIIGHLHLLWHWALDFAPDGRVTQYDPADLADAAMWDGDPTCFVEALTAVGFLDQDVLTGLTIHHWYDYAGKLIERRKADAARKHSGPRPTDPPPHSTGVPPEIPRSSNGVPTEPVESPSVTVPSPYLHLTLTTETIPPTPQPDPLPIPGAGADTEQETPTTKPKKPRGAPSVPGWDYPLLWQLITAQQGYAPDWDYGKESIAVNRILAKHPHEQPGDLARFLAYKGACFRADPHGQVTFTATAADYPGWVAAGKPARPSKGGEDRAALYSVTGQPYRLVQKGA